MEIINDSNYSVNDPSPKWDEFPRPVVKKSVDSLRQLLANEENKLNRIIKKKEQLEAKANTRRKNIYMYSILLNSGSYVALSNELADVGFGFDDIMAAITMGDFSFLQTKYDQSRAAKELGSIDNDVKGDSNQPKSAIGLGFDDSTANDGPDVVSNVIDMDTSKYHTDDGSNLFNNGKVFG